MAHIKILCYIARGGTSKGIFIEASRLPAKLEQRDILISKLFGSPDVRQIDGLGGADPLTSKVAILSRSSHNNADVDYLSGEVRITSTEINYGIMCGNLISAVPLVAYDMGLVGRKNLEDPIIIYNLNRNIYINARVKDDSSNLLGRSNTIYIEFENPGGSTTGLLLPTGNTVDTISIRKGSYNFSLVDCGALYAFFKATDFGFTGHETPAALDSNIDFKKIIEELRVEIVEYVNTKAGLKLKLHPGQLKIAIIAPTLDKDLKIADLSARVINPDKTHKAYAVSGAMATGAAALINGTFVNEIAPILSGNIIKIQHPQGVMDIEMILNEDDKNIGIASARVTRESRIIMKGTAYVDL